MKITITLEKAFEILENASSVIVNDDALIYPGLSDLEGDDENQFMYLSWEDGDGNGYSLRFCEGDNKTIEMDGNSLFLFDTDANDDEDKTKITILD